jgi:hypothetical protein
VLAGPHCTKALRDLGADVIKIEPPLGNVGRVTLPHIGDMGLYFVQQNAGKRSLSLDLNWPGSPAHRASCWRLTNCGTGDLAALEPSSKAVEFEALSDTEFVLGSAAPHEHDLILGYYSVHTSPDALRDAETYISAIKK